MRNQIVHVCHDNFAARPMIWRFKHIPNGVTPKQIDIEVFGDAPYDSFTKAFDVEVAYDTVYDVIEPDNRYDPSTLLDNRKLVSEWQQRHAQKMRTLRNEISGTLSGWSFPNTLVTILLDHSGSLVRDYKQHIVYLIASELDEALLRSNVAFEMLGFTTRSWRGGQSRKAWQKRGSPPRPGRLCDLLHIEYRSWFDKSEQEDRYALLLDPQVLKENIDGEALEWASQRFGGSPFSKHLVIMISDGAPVDDSTLVENAPNILYDHLKLMIDGHQKTENKDLLGLGIGYSLRNICESSDHLTHLQDVPDSIPSLIDRIEESLNRLAQ